MSRQVSNTTTDPYETYLAALYQGRPMYQVAREWCARLGLTAGNAPGLAAVLGIRPDVAAQWMQSADPVQMDQIARYDRRITAIECQRLSHAGEYSPC